jgi:thymidylate synthase
MRQPVVLSPSRKLSYQFMAAEAYWILTGDNRVKTIAPFNKRIHEFSDDGEIFFGAYGPKILDQLDYIIQKLKDDRDTRQAGLTIWRENPPRSKDIPCTISAFFNIRNDKLNAHVFMRSSDIWLGIPYDLFNFSMLGHLICGHLNQASILVSPGQLYLTAASSHLYSTNWAVAERCIFSQDLKRQNCTSPTLFHNPKFLMDTLDCLRFSKPGNLIRWWEVK